MTNLNKKNQLLACTVAFLIFFAWTWLFINYMFPITYPVLLERHFWTIWLVSGFFMAPGMLLMCYVVIRITGSLWQFNRTQWKIVIVGTPLAIIFLASFGYIFSLIIPSNFEGIRSITLPCILLALVFIIFGKTKYAKKYQVRKPVNSTS